MTLGYGEEFSYLTFAHGTITANRDAPSELSIVDIETFVYAAMASTGFITLVPDFIGFGSSRKIMHPYYVEETSALAVIDGLRAVRELMNQEEIISDATVELPIPISPNRRTSAFLLTKEAIMSPKKAEIIIYMINKIEVSDK